MSMTEGDEKKLILLTAILRSGGQGTKEEILDAVEVQQLMVFKPRDREQLGTRSKLVWRNNLAFVRLNLVREDCISSIRGNNWAITEIGRQKQ